MAAFPQMPDLPEDPVAALRLCWKYLQSVANYLAPFWLIATSIAGPVVLFSLACLILGFDQALSWGADLVPLGFAVISVIVSVKRLRDEHQSVVITFVLVLGFLGTLVMHYSRVHDQEQHNGEVTQLRTKMDAVKDQNTQVLAAVVSKPPLSSQEAEMQRRQNIEKALTGEYILSHDNISPGLLAGTEFPAAEWMNKRLAELGEHWTVSQPPKTATSIPQRTYLTWNGSLRIPEKVDAQGNKVSKRFFEVGDELAINYYMKVSGPNSINVMWTAKALDTKPDSSPNSQHEFISEFNAEVNAEWKQPHKIIRSVWMPDYERFDTVYAATPTKEHRKVTQLDVDSMSSGTEVLFAVIEIAYMDNNTLHHLRTCEFLQPPGYTLIWHACDGNVFKTSD